jgi:hypothetical protein
MRNPTMQDKRNKLIYSYYCTRWAEGIRHEVIIEELVNQFHIAVKTVNDVIRAERKLTYHDTVLPGAIANNAASV